MVPSVDAGAKALLCVPGFAQDLEDLRERHFDATIQFDQLLEKCCAYGQAGRQSDVRRTLAAAERLLHELQHIEAAIKRRRQQEPRNPPSRRPHRYVHGRGRYGDRRTSAPAPHC
jgi:hypothetical protein